MDAQGLRSREDLAAAKERIESRRIKLLAERPLRIGFLTSEYPTASYNGGIGSYVCQMAHTLAELGHSVHVLLCAPLPESLTWDGPVPVHTIGMPEAVSYLRRPLGKRLGMTLAIRLAEVAKRYGLELLEAPEYLGLTAFLSLVKPPSLRVIVRLHTCSSICRFLNQYRPTALRARLNDSVQDWLERRAIQTADSVTAISNATVDLTSKILKLRREHFFVTANPVNDLYFSPSMDGSFSAEPLVLFAGRLEWRKGPDVLISALPKILEHHPSARFCLAGGDTTSGPNGTSMHCYLSSRVPEQARARVEFAGFLRPEELLRRYHESTICAFPSRWEGFGLVAAEAMACGKPVIVSDTPGFREIIVDRVTGIFARSEDPQDLAASVSLLLRDSPLRQRLGCAAREMAITRFHGTAVAESMLRIYREAIASAK